MKRIACSVFLLLCNIALIAQPAKKQVSDSYADKKVVFDSPLPFRPYVEVVAGRSYNVRIHIDVIPVPTGCSTVAPAYHWGVLSEVLTAYPEPRAAAGGDGIVICPVSQFRVAPTCNPSVSNNHYVTDFDCTWVPTASGTFRFAFQLNTACTCSPANVPTNAAGDTPVTYYNAISFTLTEL